ncbi:MAG: hypothetical protein P8I56_04785 [Paracoccaceae bacterium]|nr:hypothetical protein [Paracoccaceae bacterium]MDG1370786.1 hypothetical protein [Paracoccaceae bacterium]MDG1970283.1 hypothetical protein [Paracoccaceae bacterium]
MRHILGTVVLALMTAACGDPEIFDRVAAPEGPVVAEAPYPKLADTPSVPPAGVYTKAAPDPSNGDATFIELAAEAEAHETRRKVVEGPVE